MNKTSFKYFSLTNLQPNYSLPNPKKPSKDKTNNSFTKSSKAKFSPQNESTSESRLKISREKHLTRTRSASNKRNPLSKAAFTSEKLAKRLSSAKKAKNTVKSTFSQNILPAFKKKKERKSVSDVYYTLFTDLMDSQNKIGVCDYKGLFKCLIDSFDSLVKVDDKFKNIANILRIYLDTEYENQERKRMISEKSKLEGKIAKLQVSLTELKRDNSIKAKNIRDLKNQAKGETVDKRVVHKMRDKLENKASQFEKENVYLRQMLDEKAKELNLSLVKERKLVKIVYNMHKKGFPVDEMVEEESDLSQSTVYFPDKVEMRAGKRNVPGLNFENLEEYASSEEEPVKKEIKGFNEEFMDCAEDFSKSWRDQVEAVKKRIN